ncbi:MAG: GMC oxidoreductase [Chitinophagales bacterium]
MKKNSLGRRKFLGLSAIATATAMGGTTFTLSSCSKEDDLKANPYETEALVIGSGFGGSVAALRLGEAGIKTTMLEMGKFYDSTVSNKAFSPAFFPDTRATWLKTGTFEMPLGPDFPLSGNKFVGVLDRNKASANGDMDIYRGTCLGGGSVVYGGMLPKPRVELWSKHFPDIEYSEMEAKWYPKVHSMIDISTVPENILNSEFYQYSRVGLEHCENAGMEKVMLPCGFDFGIVNEELSGQISKSVLNSEMIFGVNSGCKNSLDKNYIPAAIGTGNVTVETLHRVESVRKLSDKYAVEVAQIDESGNAIKYKTYTCKYLFVNAGVVGTMNILLKAKYDGGLANLNEHVGQAWGNNGNTMAMRSNLNDDTGGKQGAIPVSGYGDLNNPVAPLLAEQAPFPLGLELKSLLMLAIVDNPERGYWQYNPQKQKAELIWNKEQHQLSIDAMKNFVARLNAANGGEINTLLVKNNGYTSNFTYHPLGGAVRNLASDAYGRLHGYDNLYCIDGSMMPGFSCCANPALTIAALAERSMEKIIAEDF